MTSSERRRELRANEIVTAHVKANVTGLIIELMEYGDEDAHIMLYGNSETSNEVAYEAHEVWQVTNWLARRLLGDGPGHRVIKLWGEHYWARGVTGQAIHMDTVIKEIAAKE
jgi:hypothetical protein